MKVSYSLDRRSRPLPRDLAPLMRRTSSYLVSTAQRRIRSKISPENAPLTQAIKGGATPLMDSGSYLASIAAKSSSTRAEAGTNKPQARLLQEGGIIRAKRAKNLAIPAGARTRTMMRRYGMTPRTCIEAMKSDGYAIYMTPKSRVLWAKKGKTGKPFPLFILKKSVKIPARPHLYIDAQDEIVILRMVENFIGYLR